MKYQVGDRVLLKNGHRGTITSSRRVLGARHYLVELEGSLRGGSSILRVGTFDIRAVTNH